MPAGKQPQLLAALNYHMLSLFLLGNLLTGGINLSIDTMSTGDWSARVVLAAYSAMLAAVAYAAAPADVT